MNTPTTGALLARDKVDRYRSFGAFGKPAYQSHVQLRAMLKAKRGEAIANYFAKPTFDPDLGELRWTAEVPGTARPLAALSPDEFTRGVEALDRVHRQLVGFVDELRAQGGSQPGGAAAFASLLEQAMKVPADGEFLYFVGEQPVIAFWGFEDRNGASVDPAVAAPRLAAPVAPPAAMAAPAMPLPVEPARRKRPWWWWLLWLLLALLLLALLLLLPRACTPGGGLDLKAVIPGLAPPEGAASEPIDERRAEAPRDQGVPGVPAVPFDGASGVPNLPPGTAPGAEPAVPAASQPGMELPPDATREPLPEAKDLPKDPAVDPLKPEPGSDPRLPDDKADRNRTDPPVPPVDPKPMQLPEDAAKAKKMDFLEGGWKAGEGLVDKRTQQPLDLSFKFGKDGQGEVTLRRPDGTVCRGPVQGRMNGGKLGIEGNQSVPCSSGGSYGAPKIECTRERGGQTQCFGVNPDGSRYFMGMQKQ